MRPPPARVTALGLLAAALVAVAGADLASAPAGEAAIQRLSVEDTIYDATIVRDAATPVKRISDDLIGAMFEDLNHGGDGGLYAELVENRSFEFEPIDGQNPVPIFPNTGPYSGLTSWTLSVRGGATGSMAVANENPLNPNNLHFLRVTALSAATTPSGGIAVRNDGFATEDPWPEWVLAPGYGRPGSTGPNSGLFVERNKTYDFSFWARNNGASRVGVRVAVENAGATATHASAQTRVASGQWTKYSGSFTATDTTNSGRLAVILRNVAPGSSVDLDMVSLFPRDTYNGRPNGLRRDLAQKVADINPGWLRFPGGCVVNVGSYNEFPERFRVYRWKETLGPVEQRPTNKNYWGYNQSNGLGYMEYFQFAEDTGAEPVPVVPVGINGCLNFTNHATPQQLETLIQETLDLIEFANGDVTTTWGAKRAALGHPEPFGLEYIGLGNEEIDPAFYAYYPSFHNAIRAKYPNVKIVSNSGQLHEGPVFEASWAFSRQQGADLVDEHTYNPPEWFLANNERYDSYDRNGPHVMVGEYSAKGNTFYHALAEASYLTGLQRNGDVVDLTAYAPILAHVDYVNWTPNLIYFDNDRSWGSANYYVQQMFGRNPGDTLIPTSVQAEPVGDGSADPLYQVVTRDSKNGEVVLKVVNAQPKSMLTHIDLAPLDLSQTGIITTLSHDLTAENTHDKPSLVSPVTREATAVGSRFDYTFPAHSVTFIRMQPAAQ